MPYRMPDELLYVAWIAIWQALAPLDRSGFISRKRSKG
jgi:hypothetical protein